MLYYVINKAGNMTNPSFNDLIELSTNHTGDSIEVDCSFHIDTNHGVFFIYSASLSYRDIILYSEKGTLTFLVDTYGDITHVELFDWSLDSDD